MAASQVSVRCCIAGGGPAGMMLGLLLARAGVDVLVLEKHADFLRDFHGDTIHPSTLEVLHELGILDDLLRLPHQKAPLLRAQFGDLALTVADFSTLPVRCPYVAFMPQWDFCGEKKVSATIFGVREGSLRARVRQSDDEPAGSRELGVDRCRVTQRPAGRKISGPFLLSEEKAGVPQLSDSHTSRSDPSGLARLKPPGVPQASVIPSLSRVTQISPVMVIENSPPGFRLPVTLLRPRTRPAWSFSSIRWEWLRILIMMAWCRTRSRIVGLGRDPGLGPQISGQVLTALGQ